MKNFVSSVLISSALMATAWAADDQKISGMEDAEVGQSTRTLLKEQVNGENRGETEPYRAESAGKAYRAYTDSIGQKTEKLESQIGNKK